MKDRQKAVWLSAISAAIGLMQIPHVSAQARGDDPSLPGYRVFALDQCINSNHNNNRTSDTRGEVSGLAGAAMSILVDTGLNMLIAAIQRAGEDRIEQYNAIAGIDRNDRIPSCLYFIKGDFEPNQTPPCTIPFPLFKLNNGWAEASETNGAPEPVRRGVCLSKPYDLALEIELHISPDNSALSVKPIFVHLNRPENGSKGPRDLLIFAGLMPPAAGAIDQSAVGNEKNGASLAHLQLNRVPTTKNGMKIEAYPLSGWVPLSSTIAIKGGTTNAVFLVTETKKGNAFMKQLGKVFAAQQAEVSNALKDEFIDSRRNTVAATQAGNEATYYEELAKYETKLSEVRTACAIFLGATTPTEGQRSAVSKGIAELNSMAAKVKAKAVVIGRDSPRRITAEGRSEASLCGSEPLAAAP